MNVSRTLESGANVATIALVAMFGWVMLRGGFAPTLASLKPPRQSSGPKVGADLNHSPLDINWSENSRTLVLGLQTGCHFCTESGPFFQKFAGAASGTKVVAVLPQTLEESRQYLANLGVRVDEIKHGQLSAIGVSGTPTLLLVDAKGIVKNVWIGKLPAEKQSEVLSAISIKP